MWKYFDRLGLRAKVAMGFSLLILLALAADVASLLSHRQALAAADAFLYRDARIAELALKSSAAMLKARRNEKDFLLKVREFGYQEAKSRYLTLVQGELADVRAHMGTIRALSDDAQMGGEAFAIEHAIDGYEAGFRRVVELHGQLGRHDAGLEGRLRQRAHAIEELLAQGAPERLTSGLLAMRRAEKDFLMRRVSTYVELFERHFDRFGADVRRASLPREVEAQLQQLTYDYSALFHEYVVVDEAIDAASLDYLGVVHTVEPMLEHLHTRAGEAAATTRATLERLGRETAWTAGATGLASLLLAIGIALLISRNIDRALRDCVGFAGRLAAGDLTARLLHVGRSEFGVIAGALNRMADALQAALAQHAEQAMELRRLNRALRVLSQCNETLVRARDEFELVTAICDHVVAIGGYRLAWVGYARHDAARRIELAAHAGTDRDYVEQLDLSWGPDAQRRGAGGTAACERRPVLAQQISTDPVFAPWREQALARGLESCLALPLIARGEVLGTLCIYAEEADAFDGEEIKILQELADDLGFGVAGLREGEARRSIELELARQTHFDALTGLANRFTLEARLLQSVADARRHGNKLALMFVDLDRFKMVNDTLGHAVGDELLIGVARVLTDSARESDTVARLGSDEFVVLLKDVESMDGAAVVAAKLIAALNVQQRLQGHEIRISASIGISLFPDDAEDVGLVMRHADLAKHYAKSLGGGHFRFFAPEMNARLTERFAMEADLRRALERDELQVHYQPQVSLATGTITGAEALVRWCHPDQGMVSPAQFIPLAEETGLIVPLGDWVLRSVCAQLRRWLDQGLPVPPVAVNLSARQFRQSNLVATIEQALAEHGLEPGLLALELTESAVMHDVDAATATMVQLKALGVGLSLDDFGTGYSSLSHLKRFPIDHLKIDQSFVRDITTDPDSAIICNSIIGLAHSLKMTVVAEGVETEEQMQSLRRRHCDELQGYLFSRPLPAPAFAELLAQERCLALPPTDEARRTILIVDDEPHVLSALRRLLRRDGYRILTAGSPGEGLALLARHDVQVILSDQRMPGMTGTEFLGRLKAIYPQTIRIVLSGYAELDSVIGAVNAGAIYRFFTKPWNDDALRRDIRESFAHHALIHGERAEAAVATA